MTYEAKGMELAIIENRKEESIEKELNFFKIFWIFLIGSFIGVILETIYCYLLLNRIESRASVIYGPFNLVYGFGAVVLTVSLYPLRNKKKSVIFMASLIYGGLFEAVCSIIQEKLFGTVSWEYSDMPFNVMGRTSLLYAFFWGVLGLVWIKGLYPKISKILEKLSGKTGKIITTICIVFMIFNMTISTLAANREKERRNGIEANSSLDEFLDKHYDSEFMQKVYPNAIPVDNKNNN